VRLAVSNSKCKCNAMQSASAMPSASCIVQTNYGLMNALGTRVRSPPFKGNVDRENHTLNTAQIRNHYDKPAK